METAYIKTPIGIAAITGDVNGVSVILVLDEGTISTEISVFLQEAVQQLQEYFDSKRTTFNLKLNPKGTVFQH
jgi:methylated-DNA-[protein]-cysteine S-methyltransferase